MRRQQQLDDAAEITVHGTAVVHRDSLGNIQVDTKDCTSLGDAELAEMADLCADGPSGYEIGFLSKAEAHELEAVLGFKVFERSRQGVAPTKLGEIVMIPADLRFFLPEILIKNVITLIDQGEISAARRAPKKCGIKTE